MPLFAYAVSKLQDIAGSDSLLIGHAYQFGMQYLNAVLLYV